MYRAIGVIDPMGILAARYKSLRGDSGQTIIDHPDVAQPSKK
jgi:hypothetical protein